MKRINKKLLIKIVSLVLAIVLAVVVAFCGYLAYRFNCDKSNATNNYIAVYTADRVKLSTTRDGMFRILKINDTHFINGTCKDDVRTLQAIKNVLDNNPCELIVVDGDLVEGFNLKKSYDKFGAISRFANLIEQYNTCWTFAPGNNDFEIDGSNEDIIAYLMQYDNFVYGNEKDIDGAMQFFIDVYSKGKMVHSVAIMDSLARKPKAIGSYQPMTKTQGEWLNKNANERRVPTSVFFHMATNEFQTAYKNGEKCPAIKAFGKSQFGDVKNDYVLDKEIADNQYITLISCAHQHCNNMCSFYNGRYYQLSSAGGYSAGRDEFVIPSCTMTTINTKDSNPRTMYSFEQISYE